MIGQGEEKLGQGFEAVGQAAANIQNLKDEVTNEQAVTQNFKTIDVMNGEFERKRGDEQYATRDQHIQDMIDTTNKAMDGMSVNQRIMFQRQTLWNLRAQIGRAVTSADNSYYTYGRSQIIANYNNTLDHIIRNYDNDAVVHEDRRTLSELYGKLGTLDKASPEQMLFNGRKVMDAAVTKIVRSILTDPKQDTQAAWKILNSMKISDDGKWQMNAPAIAQAETMIRNKELDVESDHWSLGKSRQITPAIGGDSNPDGVVISPATPVPTQPAEPIPSVQPPQTTRPDTRSELDPAGRALANGDYLGYAVESHRPHATVQQASLPTEITRGVSAGPTEVQSAISDAARATGMSQGTLQAIASIESNNQPGSNRNKSTQYKGLFQIGREEWRQYGEGDIYDAHDNAMAAARMLRDHASWFQEKYGRAPTDAELYMMHQQGRGFYSRGIMTNVAGNRYPGMRGPQSRASFQAGWERELARRKGVFSRPEFIGA
jgi:hypothetical protein